MSKNKASWQHVPRGTALVHQQRITSAAETLPAESPEIIEADGETWTPSTKRRGNLFLQAIRRGGSLASLEVSHLYKMAPACQHRSAPNARDQPGSRALQGRR
jgi:hypothetical protein